MSNPNLRDENWFWSIIDLVQRDRAELEAILIDLSQKDIYAFQHHFVDLSAELQDEPYTSHMEISEDGQEDIAHWIVSGGKKYYQNVLNDPNATPHSVEGLHHGNLYGVANKVFYDKFRDQLDIY